MAPEDLDTLGYSADARVTPAKDGAGAAPAEGECAAGENQAHRRCPLYPPGLTPPLTVPLIQSAGEEVVAGLSAAKRRPGIFLGVGAPAGKRGGGHG